MKTLSQIGTKELVEIYQNSLAVLVAYNVLIVILSSPFILLFVVRELRAGRRLYRDGGRLAKILAWWIVIDVVGTILFTEALRQGEMSIVGPLRHTGTVVSFFIGYFWFHQKEAWQRKLAGSLVILIGALFLQGFRFSSGDFVPTAFAVVAGGAFAVLGIFDRTAVDRKGLAVHPILFAFACFAVSGVAYGIGLYVVGSIATVLPVVQYTLATPHLLLGFVMAGAIALWFTLHAAREGEVVQVSAVLRLGVLTSMGAGALFFEEDLTDKLLGGSVLFAGVVLVAIPSKKKE
ncbi:DMT family transporter [Candidatus Kaiserbacteria bacterium]|nr:DMT family transporter [Candidatus Kaiserbacteria bacterium]